MLTYLKTIYYQNHIGFYEEERKLKGVSCVSDKVQKNTYEKNEIVMNGETGQWRSALLKV